MGFFGYHWYDFGYDFGIFKSIKQKYEQRNFLPRATHFSLCPCFWLISHLRVLSCHMHLFIRITILNSFEHWLKCYLRLCNLFSDSGEFVGSFRHTLAIVGKCARREFWFDVLGEFNDGMFFGWNDFGFVGFLTKCADCKLHRFFFTDFFKCFYNFVARYYFALFANPIYCAYYY